MVEKAIPRPKPINFERLMVIEEIKGKIDKEIRIWLEDFAIIDGPKEIILKDSEVLKFEGGREK